MRHKVGDILLVIILTCLLLILTILGYLLYQYIPGKPEELTAIIKKPKLEIENLSYKVKQFYPNMKFNHNDISYRINPDCGDEKKEGMINAFNKLSNEIEVISFYPAGREPDIEVSCSKANENLLKGDFFIAGEGGAKEIIQTGSYNVIVSALVLLYSFPNKSIECDWPNLELHELLHVFGFEHSRDRNSLMHPYLESCEQKLDDSIIQDLKGLYSQKNLSDLYFEKATAIKKGIYLDFNVTIKNSGVVDANGVALAVFDAQEEVGSFNLNNIPFGGGITFQVYNLKLKSRTSENIKIVLDPKDSIEEIDENDNVAKLVFS